MTSWARAFVASLSKHAVLKTFGVPAFMALFFVVYFLVANHPMFPVTVMPTTALDRFIGFQPWTLWLYGSLWVYVSLAPGLIVDRRELMQFALAALILSVIGLAVFFFWPTATPQPAIDWAHYPSFEFLKNADRARNACPSLHVAFSVFSAFWIDRSLRRINTHWFVRTLSLLWAAGIIYSTLATKQHVTIDALAGAVLGGEAAVLHQHLLQRARRARFGFGNTARESGISAE